MCLLVHVLASECKVNISGRPGKISPPVMCVRGILLIQVDFKKPIMLVALEVLVPISTISIQYTQREGYVRVHFLKVEVKKAIFGSFHELVVVTGRDEVPHGLLWAIVDLFDRLYRIWCIANRRMVGDRTRRSCFDKSPAHEGFEFSFVIKPSCAVGGQG